MLAGLAPARRRLLLALLAVGLATVLAAAVALVVGRADGGPAAPPVSQDELGPVLLVPGYGGSGTALEPLARRLRDAGRDATVVALPGDGTGDLAEAADALAGAAGDALDRTGAGSVDVVGYSAGGVVARLWIAGGDAAIRRVVTLGSPHHGTTVADLAASVASAQCPEACRQLTTDSDLLAGLNADDETPAGPTWVSIWTETDATVTPPGSARLDGALDLPVQSVCADATPAHGDLPRDPLVQAMVLAELADGDPVPLGPADCARLSS